MVLPPNQSLPVVPKQQFIVKPLVKAIEKAYEKFNTGSVILKQKPVILEIFSKMKDPRLDRKKRHLLSEIIVLAICAVVGGADDWVGIESFGKYRYDWFKEFLSLPNGIPSHDTFGRVFSLISPDEFESCFMQWICLLRVSMPGEIVAIDGKTLRRSHDQKHGKSAIHMVSAWALENNLVLGQLKTDSKSNEITAISKLIQLLDLSGCIVTIDAMGCQKEIASLIISKQAHYVLALKANQRTVRGKTSVERRFFISSLEKNVDLFAKAVRQHWGIENSVHWILDISFREDESRIRNGHAPENMAVLRHIALNLLRNDETPLGIKNKRLKAGRNTDYLAHVLRGEMEKMDEI